MNYFKILFCALLALPTASFAMPEPGHIKTVPRIQLRIDAGIDGQTRCIGGCHKKAKLLAGDSLRFTGCCWQFICAHDVAKIPINEETKEKECPFCKKQFSVHKITLSNEKVSFRFIDVDGVEDKITNYYDYEALKKCEIIRNMISDGGGMADFRNKPLITNANIKRLIEYIKDPSLIRGQWIHQSCFQQSSFEENKQMLHVASYMEAPEKILFELSNLLWDDLQDKESDSNEIKEEKKRLRGIAEEYLHCPKYLLKIRPSFFDFSRPLKGLPLSYSSIVNASPIYFWDSDQREYKYVYDKHHPFITLRGLRTLIEKSECKRAQLDLSGHAIQLLRLKDLNGSHAKEIDLSHNKISTIDTRGVYASHLPQTLNLQNNKIASLDDEFFKWLKHVRSSGKLKHDLTINLENNLLTEKDKKEYAKKIYAINHTLPERVNWERIKKCMARPLYVTLPLSGATSAAAIEYFCMSQSTSSDKIAATFLGTLGGAVLAKITNDSLIYGKIKDETHAINSLSALISSFYLVCRLSDKLTEIYKPTSFLGETGCNALALSSLLVSFPLIGLTPLLIEKARNKISDIASTKLARITHPEIKAHSFDELANAKRINVKF